MKIGIISDSHGSHSRLKLALQLIAEAGATAVVHCGDVGTAESIKILGRSGLDVYVVAGNTDRDVERMTEISEQAGVHCHGDVMEVPLDEDGGEYLVATHGDDEMLLGALIAGQQFPYVCHGHTHRIRDEQYESVRVICPGALRYNRDPKPPTFALLDTATGKLEHIDLKTGRPVQPEAHSQ